MLDAAAALADERHVDDIAVHEIPDQLGLAKGTMYRYFGSKEEIFLSVLERDLRAFGSAVVDRLRELEGSDDLEAAASAVVDPILARPRMCNLLALMPNGLMRNVDERVAQEFWEMRSQVNAAISDHLGAALPCLGDIPASPLIGHLQALVIGTWATAADDRDGIALVGLGESLKSAFVAMVRGSCRDGAQGPSNENAV